MTTETPSFDPVPLASKDLSISARQVAAVAKLFAEGNTVPFIARYRKEAHGNLDEVQITGDLVIDGSIRGKLERLGTALTH